MDNILIVVIDEFLLVLEYAEGGTLRSYLKEKFSSLNSIQKTFFYHSRRIRRILPQSCFFSVCLWIQKKYCQIFSVELLCETTSKFKVHLYKSAILCCVFFLGKTPPIFPGQPKLVPTHHVCRRFCLRTGGGVTQFCAW